MAAAATPCAGPRAGPWRGRTGVPAFSTISSSKSGHVAHGSGGSGHGDHGSGELDGGGRAPTAAAHGWAQRVRDGLGGLLLFYFFIQLTEAVAFKKITSVNRSHLMVARLFRELNGNLR